MGRIIKDIEIEGKPAVALFDTGALHTYVRPSYLESVPRRAISHPLRVALGGRGIDIREHCLTDGKIEGLDFSTDAVPLEDIGRVEGRDLDALIGAMTMERYEIKLDPRAGTLDLEGLRRREFTEFQVCFEAPRFARIPAS